MTSDQPGIRNTWLSMAKKLWLTYVRMTSAAVRFMSQCVLHHDIGLTECQIHWEIALWRRDGRPATRKAFRPCNKQMWDQESGCSVAVLGSGLGLAAGCRGIRGRQVHQVQPGQSKWNVYQAQRIELLQQREAREFD
jgi:hypothetical protein